MLIYATNIYSVATSLVLNKYLKCPVAHLLEQTILSSFRTQCLFDKFHHVIGGSWMKSCSRYSKSNEITENLISLQVSPSIK